MKKILLLSSLIFLFSCSKEKSQEQPQATTGKATFWFYSHFGDRYDLIVDGHEYGLLTHDTAPPACSDQHFQTMELSVGTHTADAKSLDGYAWGNPQSFTVTGNGCVVV